MDREEVFSSEVEFLRTPSSATKTLDDESPGSSFASPIMDWMKQGLVAGTLGLGLIVSAPTVVDRIILEPAAFGERTITVTAEPPDRILKKAPNLARMADVIAEMPLTENLDDQL